MRPPPELDGPRAGGTGPPAAGTGTGVAPPRGPPRWPWWFVLVAPITMFPLLVIMEAAVAIAVIVGGGDLEHQPPAAALGLGFGFDAALIVTALSLPFLRARPHASDFGLRATPLWPAVGWSVLAMASFTAFAAVYNRLLAEDVTQTTLDELGVGRSPWTLVAGGVLIVAVAPIGEEFFFRGFVYRALRSRLGVPAAVVIAGALFGLPHLPTGITAVPPLAVLGMGFCLVYERTGSIFPTIALHSLNNAFAYSLSSEAPDGSWRVALPLIALMMAGCLLLPRRLDSRAVRAPDAPAPAPG